MAEREVTLKLSTKEEAALAASVQHLSHLIIDGKLPYCLSGFEDEIGKMNAALNANR